MLLPYSKKKLYFKPGLLLTIITVCAVLVFYALGVWQLERAETKKVMARQISERIAQPPLVINEQNINQLMRPNVNYRFIEISGRYEQGNQFFVDNKKHNGRAGYHVITPFKISNTEQRILVNRGWVDAGNQRQVLPEIITPAENINLTGQLSEPARSHFRPGISQPAEGLGGVWLYIDINYFTSLANTLLAPYVLLLNKDQPHGYVRDWSEFKANTEMHIGYAIQWFAFAIFALLAYVSFGIKKHE